MNETTKLHHQAMAQVDEALAERRAGEHARARAKFAAALALEHDAAVQSTVQPSRSILFRSAAWLALEAEDAAEAERLAACGLADLHVPERLKAELRAVAEEARLRLYRALPPPTAVSSITLHLEGPEVGFGGAHASDVDPRVSAIHNAIVRTAERKAGREFRRHGAPPPQIAQQLQPRRAYAAGSVVVQVTLGGDQPDLWDANGAIVAEVSQGLRAFAEGGEESLRELIPDAVYRDNFAVLATQIAPDGKRVTSVDVSAATARGPLPVVRLRSRAPVVRAGPRGRATLSEVEGYLRAADEIGAKNKIKIQNDHGTHTIFVRDAVMEDIVRPFYGERVRVTVRARAQGFDLVGLPVAAAEHEEVDRATPVDQDVSSSGRPLD